MTRRDIRRATQRRRVVGLDKIDKRPLSFETQNGQSLGKGHFEIARLCHVIAFALARRLKKQERQSGPRQVRVLLPKTPGTDWADVWLAKAEHTAQTA